MASKSNNSVSFLQKKHISIKRENQWIIVMLLDKLSTVEPLTAFRYAIKHAITSLVQYNQIVNTKDDAKKVKYIGKKISAIIEKARLNKNDYDNRVQPYVDRHETEVFIPINKDNDKNKNQKKSKPKPKRKKRKYVKIKKRKQKAYYPRYRCGNWAILYVMTINKNNNEDNDYKEYTKSELINDAQPYCDSNYLQATSENPYSAWSGLHYLIDNQLITQTGRPAIHKLTDKGYEMGKKCIKEREQHLNSIGLITVLTQQSKLQVNDNDVDTYYNDYDIIDIKENIPKTPIKNIKNNKNVIPKTPNRNKNKKRKINVLDDITNTYMSPPPRKRIKTDISSPSSSSSLFGLHDMEITDQLQLKYNLSEAITLKNGNKYRLYLNIDSRENVYKNKMIKRIDIWYNLNSDLENKVPVQNMKVNSGDYHWLLININNNKDIKLINVYLERKQWGDLAKSLKDGRYWMQKDLMKFAINDDVILTTGRVIYLIEDRIDRDVGESLRNRCKQARVDTEARDKFNVVCTKSKHDTLRLLVNYTYIIREWISGDNYVNLDGYLPDINNKNKFNENNLIQLNIFNDIIKEAYSVRTYKISSRMRFMKLLLNIDGVDQRVAWYITKKYQTLRVLWNEWMKCEYDDDLDILLPDIDHDDDNDKDIWLCPECSTKYDINNADIQFCAKDGTSKKMAIKIKEIENEKRLQRDFNDKAQLLLHDTVILEPYWKYIEEIINLQECQKPDNDIMNVINICKQQNNENNEQDIEYVSQEISKKIWIVFASDKIVL